MPATRSVSLMAVPAALPTQERISSSIEALLDVLGLDQSELAGRVGMAQPTMNKSLRNKRKLTLEETEAIAAALNAPLPLLFEGGEEIRRRAVLAIFGTDTEPDDGPGLGVSPSAWDADVIDLGARRSRTPVLPAPSMPDRQVA